MGFPPVPGSGVLGGYFPVTSYGAKGDGTTDDSGAIQAAINAAHPALFAGIGSTVYFPPGKYYVATGLTCTNPGTVFLSEGQGGWSSDLATGDTQIIVGDNIWGLTLGSAAAGEYRGYRVRGLQFYEQNAGGAYGGVHLLRSSNGLFEASSFGKFTKSVKTTFGGAGGTPLSGLGTLTLASVTGWPTGGGSGWIVTNGDGTSGQPYHSFWYTGVSGSTLTGCTYGNPQDDTVASGAEIGCAVGAGFCLDAGGAGNFEASYNTFSKCFFGTATLGYVQLGTSTTFFDTCKFDGAANALPGSPTGTGLKAVTGTILSDNCGSQSYDMLIHLCRGNDLHKIDFRFENYGLGGGVVLEPDSGLGAATIFVPGAESNATHDPAIIVKSGVNTPVIHGLPQVTPGASVPWISDQGTATRYTSMSGQPLAGPSVVGSVVGRTPQYDQLGTLIGYSPIYNTISGVALKQKLGGCSSAIATTSIARTLTSAVSVGDLILIGGGYGQGTTRTISAADNAAGTTNVYTVDRHDDKTTGNSPHSFVISCPVTTAIPAGTIITITFSASVNFPVAFMYDYFLQNASATDSQIGATGTQTAGPTTPPASGNLSTAADYDLLFAACYYVSTATLTPSGSFVIQDSAVITAKEIAVMTSTAGAAGTYSAGGTLSVSGASEDWAISLASYKKA